MWITKLILLTQAQGATQDWNENADETPHKLLYSKILSEKEGTLKLFLPVPIPLSTAPSLTPDALVLLVGALWGARLGRNRHLARTTENRFMTFTGANSCKKYHTRFYCTCSSLERDSLQVYCCSWTLVWRYMLEKNGFWAGKNNLASKKKCKYIFMEMSDLKFSVINYAWA